MEFDEARASSADSEHQGINFATFCKLIREREVSAEEIPEEELRERFLALDTNGSGIIGKDEYMRFSLRDSLARSASKLMSIFSEWDINQDGVSVLAHASDLGEISEGNREVTLGGYTRPVLVLRSARWCLHAFAHTAWAHPALNLSPCGSTSACILPATHLLTPPPLAAPLLGLPQSVDVKEFQRAIRALGFDEVSDRDIEHIFREYDLDGGGTISRFELESRIKKHAGIMVEQKYALRRTAGGKVGARPGPVHANPTAHACMHTRASMQACVHASLHGCMCAGGSCAVDPRQAGPIWRRTHQRPAAGYPRGELRE